MVGIVAGRAEGGLAVFAHGEVVRYRDRLAVRYEKAVVGPFVGGPRPYLHRHAGALQVDGRPAAEVVARAIGREMPLVRAPAQFRGLTALADEPVHRPRIR